MPKRKHDFDDGIPRSVVRVALPDSQIEVLSNEANEQNVTLSLAIENRISASEQEKPHDKYAGRAAHEAAGWHPDG